MNKILILGSANIDYISHVSDFPKPGETISAQAYHIEQGGKGANQAVAVARLGGGADFITCIGDDKAGEAMLSTWQQDGIRVASGAIITAQNTGSAQITVTASGENNIIIASGANQYLNEAVVTRNADLFQTADYLLLQLETPMQASILAASKVKQAGGQVILNPAPAQSVPMELLRHIDIITPNETEASSLSGIPVTDEQSAIQAANKIHDFGINCVIITLGSKGALVSVKEHTAQLIPTHKVDVVDTVAAGDTFNGALLVALSEGKTLTAAVQFAHAAAALAVTKKGAQASVPSRAELTRYIATLSSE